MPNYVAATIAALAEALPGCEPDLIRLYALLALTSGKFTTEREVHIAWSAWRHATNPGHPALIPFDDLSVQVQALDTPYAEAIRAVAIGAAPELSGMDSAVERLAGDVAVLTQERDAARTKLANYENAITWDTTCTSCAAVLDSSIRETERREQAEAERDRYRQHSVTLNKIAFRIARTLGRVPDDADSVNADPVELSDALIAERDRLAVEARVWKAKAQKAWEDEDRDAALRLTQLRELSKAQATIRRVRALTLGSQGHQLHPTKQIAVAEILTALGDASPVDSPAGSQDSAAEEQHHA